MGLVPDVKQSMLNSHFLYILLIISVMHYWAISFRINYFNNQSGQFQFCKAYKISTDTSCAILDNLFLVCISFVMLDNYLSLWPVPVLQYLIIFCLEALTWFCKNTLFSHSSDLTHFCVFIIHWPGLVLQGHIIFSFIRPDPLLHVYSTSAWPGFARLYYFPPNQA